MPPLDWCDDQELGPGFRQLTLSFTPDYDGEVTASVVRNRRLLPPTTAADTVYLHGFVETARAVPGGDGGVGRHNLRGVNPIAKSFSNLR